MMKITGRSIDGRFNRAGILPNYLTYVNIIFNFLQKYSERFLVNSPI